ncbi:unnamed protein product [Penicillium pancosmium]
MTASTPPVRITVTVTHVVHSKYPTLLQDPFILGPFNLLGHFATPTNAVWIYEPLSSANLVSLERLRNAIRNALLTPWHLSPDKRQQDPIFTIQRTEFACSSVAIGMRLSHVVAGAGGFLGLHQDLAAIYRATTDPAIDELPVELPSPPCLTPYMVTSMQRMGVDEPRKTLTESLPGYSMQQDLDHDNGTRAEAHAKNEERYQNSLKTDPIVGRTLQFSPEVLATLESRAVDPNEQ